MTHDIFDRSIADLSTFQRPGLPKGSVAWPDPGGDTAVLVDADEWRNGGKDQVELIFVIGLPLIPPGGIIIPGRRLSRVRVTIAPGETVSLPLSVRREIQAERCNAPYCTMRMACRDEAHAQRFGVTICGGIGPQLVRVGEDAPPRIDAGITAPPMRVPTSLAQRIAARQSGAS